MVEGLRGQIPSQRSIDLLGELHRRVPDDRNVAKALIYRLWQLESISLLDETLKQCVKRLNDPVFFEWWILLALVWGEPSVTDERIEYAIRAHGTRLAFLRYKIDNLIAQGKFDLAESLAGSIEEAAPQPTLRQEFHRLLKNILIQSAINAEWKRLRSDGRPRDYQLYYINLDTDIHRAQRMERQLKSWSVPFERIAAVKGSLLPGSVSAALTRGESINMKGTLGCFLSHVSAWERLIESDLDYAMILEDDAKFLLPPPPSLAVFCKEDFDVLFINHRMAFTHEDQSDPRIQIKSVKEVVSFKPPSWRAAGTDGYFISRTGAERLIEWVCEDGLWGDVDWRLIFYALGKEWRTCLPADGFAQTAVSHHARRCKEREAIRAFVLSPALIGHHRGGSARHSMNGFPHAHLEIKGDSGT